ncbi:hypothetical protein [Streptomyces sp. NPDC055134]
MQWGTSVAHQEADDKGARFEVGLSAASPGPARVRRTFDRQAAGRLTITDSFEFATVVDELFIGRIRPTLVSGSVLRRGAHGTARLSFDPGQCHAAVEEIPLLDHHARAETVHRLRLGSKGQAPTTAVFELAVGPSTV